MGGQRSPFPWRRTQTFGWWRQEGRWTQGEVRESDVLVMSGKTQLSVFAFVKDVRWKSNIDCFMR